MSAPNHEQLDRAFRVPLATHLFGSLVHGYPTLSVALGNLESRIVRDRLDQIVIDRPIFIAGLARSGTTILLEVLAQHRRVVTHRYRDFPPVFTPYWWQEVLKRGPQVPAAVAERAHGDGLLVGPESPEAMEEPIWMAFFPEIHAAHRSQVLDARTSHPRFERFYENHIRKLLLSRGGERYLSKGNYNVSRLQYLLKLFPDARLVIPVRHPRSHIASLMKQHRLFIEGETRHPRALTYMRRVGHFEFGLDRRPIHTGDPKTISSIVELWKQGDETRGWARYWAALYGWLADQLEEDLVLREASVVVRYEDLCEHPRKTLSSVLTHTQLDDCGLSSRAADQIRAPGYYRPKFAADEELAIAEESAAVAERFGYVSKAPRVNVDRSSVVV